MVLGQGLRLAGTGPAAGLTAALLLARFAASLLPGLQCNDPLAVLAAPGRTHRGGCFGLLYPRSPSDPRRSAYRSAAVKEDSVRARLEFDRGFENAAARTAESRTLPEHGQNPPQPCPSICRNRLSKKQEEE